MVDELSENLTNRGYQAEGLHGDLTQKQRDFVMNRFKNGSLQILIATDVAARGIDVDDLEAVFNYDIPQDIEYYVHRIGRTGRAGKEGMAFTFAYGRDLYKIRDIERVCKTKMEEQKLPRAAQIMDRKLNKLLKEATEKYTTQAFPKLEEQIEEKLADLELDPMELLAVLVRMQIGEEPEEIIVEEPRRYKYEERGTRDGRRRHQEDHRRDEDRKRNRNGKQDGNGKQDRNRKQDRKQETYKKQDTYRKQDDRRRKNKPFVLRHEHNK